LVGVGLSVGGVFGVGLPIGGVVICTQSVAHKRYCVADIVPPGFQIRPTFK
jgi:hypothetical protein